MTNRRQLATELGQELALEVKYLGVPSCAYQVGNYTINKDGTIDGDLEAIRDFLINHGIIHNEPVTSSTDTRMTESTPLSPSDVDSIELSMENDGDTDP